jgi:hypothetical protein
MAAADWRTASLIASIRRRGNAPSSSSGWNDADFLAALNEELRSYVVPLIRRINEEYLVAYTDVSVVAGTARYRIPAAALGESLRDVGFLDPSTGEFLPLERVDPGNRSVIGGYYLENEDVVLWPAPNTSDTMRLKYIRRPSKLVGDERVLERSGGTTTYAAFGDYALDGETAESILGPLIEAAGMDIVSARPGFRCIGEDIAVTYATNAFTWTGATSTDAEIGDYLCYAGESPVPQIPAEAHPLLAQATLCQYLRASGQPGLSEAEARRAQMEADIIGLFTPRTQEQPHRVVNRYGPGWWNFRPQRRWRP